MRQKCALLVLPLACLLYARAAFASAPPGEQACPRSAAGSTLQNPPELRSQNGVLEVSFHFRYQATTVGQGPPRYCYITDTGMESPTLRVHPGDQLIIHFHNDLPAAQMQPMKAPMTMPPAAARQSSEQTDCKAEAMDAAITNLHFHGLSVPPTCHQDDVIRTAVLPGEGFEYRVTIPKDEPPGLYWYHPHPHGYSERQVQGGASGALIVEGLENVYPSLAGLRERVIVLRDQPLSNPGFIDSHIPAWDVSINYVPVIFPAYLPATIATAPSRKELWRVLNAGANTILDLQVVVQGVPRSVKMVALDGVPVTGDSRESSILLPPGARAEFVVETPKVGEQAQLVTRNWDTGPEGDRDPSRPLANLVSTEQVANEAGQHANRSDATKAWRPRADGTAIVQRRLYFSQLTPNPKEGDTSVFYFVTVSGQTPAAYRMGQAPNIVVHEGNVEDWVVENRAPEDHTFHIHQIHFRVLEVDGKPVNDPALRDTVEIPYWPGSGPYPSVKLRMDFRDPDIVGTFLFHCHILKHEDMGMMGVIEVLPPGLPTVTTLKAPAKVGIATSVSIVATVEGKDAGRVAPGGTAQFAVDGISTGKPVAVVDGKAAFTTSFEAGGVHEITATYAGDRTYDVSASRAAKVRVTE
jgi:FtsP/CotA-like multicopper oxidase with cupredoxin domain